MTKEKGFRHEEEAVLLLNKGKQGIVHLIFGRTGVIILLLAVQIVLLVLAFVRLQELYFGSAVLLSVVVALVEIGRKGNPSVKLSWVLLTMAVPVFAIPFYILVNADLGHRLAHFRLREIDRETAKYAPPRPELREELAQRDGGAAQLAAYLERKAGFPLYKNSDAKYFPLGENMFEEVLEQLEKARNFIFMEYFIIEEGYMWGRILSVLERKVKEGLEVRVLYDGTCAVTKVPYQYPQELQKLGIQCKMYAPLRPLVSTHYNNRDHRKILVVDGRVAFTGGINLADEYINRRVLHGHWKDTAVMISGEAVRGFTLMFLQMWNVDTRRVENYERYLNASFPVDAPGYILPYGDRPFDEELVGETVYIDILNRAQRYVHITTPYLIVDNELLTALTYAAKRGVEVVLIVPAIPDKTYVYALNQTYYRELIEAGVEVREYTPGFVHAKMFVSDDTTAVVGSINLDYRSLYLHFECAALLYGCAAVADVERDIQETRAKSRAITLEDCKRRKLIWRFLGWILRPLAPLM